MSSKSLSHENGFVLTKVRSRFSQPTHKYSVILWSHFSSRDRLLHLFIVLGIELKNVAPKNKCKG